MSAEVAKRDLARQREELAKALSERDYLQAARHPEAATRHPRFPPHVNESVGFQDLPANSGPLRRFEFVSACEVLLANSPGCASIGDLHDLFDLLDPGSTGGVPLQKFAAVLRAHQKPGTKPGAPLWSELGVVGAPSTEASRLKSALSGLRTWMLQHSLLFQDLTNVFRDDSGLLHEHLPWPEFGDRLTARVPTPWITPAGAKEIFDQLKVPGVAPPSADMVHGPALPSHVVRIQDLIEAMLDAKPFAEDMTTRAIRVVFREAHHRKVNVAQQFRVVDAQQTGLVDRPQLKKILDSICPSPNSLADADISCIEGKFLFNRRFRYDYFLKALECERQLYAEHVLKRALPRLQTQAVEFAECAAALDEHKHGYVTSQQLRKILSEPPLSIGLDTSPNVTELDDFIDFLVKSTRLDKDQFKYGKIVRRDEWTGEKRWMGPSVDECLKVICGTTLPKAYDDDNIRLMAPRAHLLPILFCEIAESARKLGLSPERAFERLDRGGKGYLSSADLQLAVLDVLGLEENLANLGLKPDHQMRFAAFQDRIDFNLHPLCEHIPEVFGEEKILKEADFVKNLAAKGAKKTLVTNWLSLLYPNGVPTNGVERSRCETFFATYRSPSGELERPFAAERDIVHSLALCAGRRHLYEKPVNLRTLVLDSLTSGGVTTSLYGKTSVWHHRTEIANLLRQNLPLDQAEETLSAALKTSALYEPSTDVLFQLGVSDVSDAVRAETLFVCAEAYEEHILEVRLESIKGIHVMRNAIKTQNRPLEVYLRYWCHGTELMAETNRLALNNIVASLDVGNVSADLDVNFTARHTFRITKTSAEGAKTDSLIALFASDDAIDVQAFGGVVGEPRRLLGVAKLHSEMLRQFLSDALSKTNSPEALLGSQKEWILPFENLEGSRLALSVLYSKQSPQSQLAPPLPWSSTFIGSLTICRRSPMANEIPADLCGPSAVVPSPGSVRLEVQVRAVALHGRAFKMLLAKCLEGCAMPAPAHGAGLGIFLRFCLFPGSPTLQVAGGCGWVQSPVTMLPEELLTDSAFQKNIVEAHMGFDWHSPLLDAAEVVASLQHSKASMELWLRTSCVPNSQNSWRVAGQLAADVRLAEASLNLKELLRRASPEEPQKLRLRTLRNVSIDPIVAFKTDKKGDVLADLISTVCMDLPSGPSVVSWLVEPDEDDALVSYVVKLREVWLSKELTASLNQAERNAYFNAGRGATLNAVRSGPQYFYAEFGQGGPNALGGPAAARAPTATLQYYRSAPVAAQADASGWLRVPLESDARVTVPKCPALGVSDATDVQIRRGEFHSMRVRVLQLMRGGGTQLAADVALQLPLGEVREGGIGSYFGVHIWRPLFQSAPESPAMAIIGRALLSVEAVHPHDQVGAPERVLHPLPLMPTGVFLPLYSSWKVPLEADPWPLEVALRNLMDALHPGLWSRLSELELILGTKGALAVEEFNDALEARELGPELDFLKSAAAAFFAEPVCSVPWVSFLYWFALRVVAARILPVAPQLLERLQQLDKSKGRLTGTVPLPTFQEVLFEELTTASIPAEWTYLRELIARRPQWTVGAVEFCGHEYFDYFAFFWDLNVARTGSSAALIDPSLMGGQRRRNPPVPGLTYPQSFTPSFSTVPWQNAPPARVNDVNLDQPSSYPDTPLAMLTIASAHHLIGGGRSQYPSTFVTYSWGDKDGLRQGDTLGNTEVIPRDDNPKWNHTANIVLPRIIKENRLVPYPDAFREVELVLQVWGVNEWNGTQWLIGRAHAPLAPLRSGFAEVDGYYKIEGAAEAMQAGKQICSDQGQIRISLTPHWAPTPSATDRSTDRLRAHQPLQNEYWSFGQYDNPSSVFAEPQVLDLGEILVATRSQKEDIPIPLPPPASMPPPLAPSPSIPVTTRHPSIFGSSDDRALFNLLRNDDHLPTSVESSVLRTVGHGPGVQDDVSTTALRFASGISAIERQLRSLEGSEEVQLEALRERHLNNLAELDQLQQEKLKKLATPPIEATPTSQPFRIPSSIMNPGIGIAPPPNAFSVPGVTLTPSIQIEVPTFTQSTAPDPAFRPVTQVEPTPQLHPLPPPAEPPDCLHQTPYEAPRLTAETSAVESCASQVHSRFPKAAWPNIGSSNLLPNISPQVEPRPQLPPLPPPAEPPDRSHQTPYEAPRSIAERSAVESCTSQVHKASWPNIGSSHLLPNISLALEAPVSAAMDGVLATHDPSAAQLVRPSLHAPRGSWPTQTVSPSEEAVVEQLRERIEALRRAEEERIEALRRAEEEEAMRQEVSDDAIVLEIMNREEEEGGHMISHSPVQNPDVAALRRLMEMEDEVDEESLRRLVEAELDPAEVGMYIGLAEEQLRPDAFTFRVPTRPGWSDRPVEGDVTRSREDLLQQVGQDVLDNTI